MPTEEHPFDDLTKAFSNSKLTRRRMLGTMGGAFVGAMLSTTSFPEVARAEHKEKHHHKPPPSAVKAIVDSRCKPLLTKMQNAHPNADVGISVGLYYPSDPNVPEFFRYGSAGPGVDVTPDTVYAIGSVTKVFTSALAAYLSVEGTIGKLDETLVNRHLLNSNCNPPGVSGSYWNEVTFEQFATHTSGMPDAAFEQSGDELFTDKPPSCPQLEYWNNSENQQKFSAQRGYWVYSDEGFVTLGFAVANAAASGYNELLNSAITSQTGMPYTFTDTVPPETVLATGYNTASKPVSIMDAPDLKSNARDMLTWLASVYQAMQLSASGASLTNLQQALADTTHTWIPDPKAPNGDSLPFAMGLGWQIPTYNSAQVLIKDGAVNLGGCSCWIGLTRYASGVPAAGIALLTNQDGVAPDPVGSRILEHIIALTARQ